jgi:hypothetical protein
MGYIATSKEDTLSETYFVKLDRFLNNNLYGTFDCIVNAETVTEAIETARERLYNEQPGDVECRLEVVSVQRDREGARA